jgi:hypothetical protein
VGALKWECFPHENARSADGWWLDLHKTKIQLRFQINSVEQLLVCSMKIFCVQLDPEERWAAIYRHEMALMARIFANLRPNAFGRSYDQSSWNQELKCTVFHGLPMDVRSVTKITKLKT